MSKKLIEIKGVSKLIKVAAHLRVASSKVGLDLQGELRAQVLFLLSRLKEESPVGVGPSAGTFAGNWKLYGRHMSSANAITSIRVYNDTHYAPAIEGGSVPGSPPWPGVPEKKARTVQSNGRIWSSQAVGGTISKITDSDLRRMQVAIGRAGHDVISKAFDTLGGAT